jgi:hypothetical protein
MKPRNVVTLACDQTGAKIMAASKSAMLCLATNADEVEEERQRSGLDRRWQCPSVLAEVA